MAKLDSFRIFSVTRELSDLVYKAFEVKIPVMPHPVINIKALEKMMDLYRSNIEIDVIRDNCDADIIIYVPTRLGHVKSHKYFFESLNGLVNVTENIKIKLRKTEESFFFYNTLKADIKHRYILVDTVSEKDYVEEILKSDVIFIPYPKDGFWARTSGILYDTIFLEKPVITLYGTWLSRVAFNLRCGLYLNDPTNEESFSSLVQRLMNSYKELSYLVKLAKDKIKDTESFHYLCELLEMDDLNQYQIRGL